VEEFKGPWILEEVHRDLKAVEEEVLGFCRIICIQSYCGDCECSLSCQMKEKRDFLFPDEN
jgi:hypothetical protein